MRHITKIILKDFQIHKYLEIDLINGINAILGKSGSGKSGFIRAIRWILYNDIKGDCIRRHVNGKPTKETYVKIIYSDNSSIMRKKTNTVNRYILNQNEKEEIFDASAKEIPEDVIKFIGMYPLKIKNDNILLNLQDQLSPHFLLVGNGLGTYRAEIFSKLTGDEVLNDITKEYNKDLLNLSRDEKNIGIDIENKKIEVKNLELIRNNKETVYNATKTALEGLEAKYKKMDSIKGLKSQITTNTVDFDRVQKAISSIIIPDNIDNIEDKIAKYLIIKELSNELLTSNEQLTIVNQKLKAFSELDKIDIDKLEKICYTYSEINKVSIWLETTETTLNNIDIELKATNEELMNKINKLKELKDKHKVVCPKCGFEIE